MNRPLPVGIAILALLGSVLPGCSNPDDPTHGSGGVQTAPEACAPGAAFAPLLSPRAVIDSGTAGGCVGCAVTDPEAVVDEDQQNFATMQVGLGLVGSAFISVFDSASTHQPGTRVGFLVAGQDDATIPLTVAVGQQLTVTTFLNGVEQESTVSSGDSPPIALQILEAPIILPGSPAPEIRYVGTVAQKEFDEVRIDFGGAVNLLNALKVFNVCLGS